MRVQVGRRCLIAGLIAGVQVVLVAPPTARAVEPSVSYTFNFYSDVNGVDVFSNYVGSGLRLSNGLLLSAEWVNDRVVIPAIDAPPGSQEAVDAITTASRPISGTADPYQDYIKVRNSLEASAGYRGADVDYYVSTESDYFAQMVSVGYNHGFLGENLNLAGRVSYSWDDIQPLQDDDTQTVPDYRRTLHWNVVATQVVTPTTVVRVGAEFNNVSGLQHDPYRNVYVAGANVPEKHPDERHRQDLFASVNQYIYNRSSINLEYRYYTDDWDVSSHAIGVKLNQYVNDTFVVRYRYRYYTQASAIFYRNEYTDVGGVNGFQTADYRLGDFGANLFGGRIAWRPYRVFGKVFPASAQLILSYERYFNSNNFSANVLETGLLIVF
jgi:hypothetical protein